jgi:hypothetical protein
VEPILDIDLGASQFDATFELLSTPEGEVKVGRQLQLARRGWRLLQAGVHAALAAYNALHGSVHRPALRPALSLVFDPSVACLTLSEGPSGVQQ